MDKPPKLRARRQSVRLVVLGCAGNPPEVDLGDSSTGNLVWGTYYYGFVEQNLEKALNDLGAIALAKGEILMRKGDRAGAEAAFSMAAQDFGYGQLQDLGEWKGYSPSVQRDARGFMNVAEVATLRLAEIREGKD